MNMLNDNDLSKVSGGAGKTPGGYPVDGRGNVHFTGVDGREVVINQADWKWLLSNYGATNPEAKLTKVTGYEVGVIIDDHHRQMGK